MSRGVFQSLVLRCFWLSVGYISHKAYHELPAPRPRGIWLVFLVNIFAAACRTSDNRFAQGQWLGMMFCSARYDFLILHSVNSGQYLLRFDQDTLLHVYRALKHSKLDYDIHIYGNARKTYLLRLRTAQHSAICIYLGAFYTSSTKSLYIAANNSPSNLGRLKLPAKYMLRLRAYISNSAYSVVFSTEDIPERCPG